MWEIAMNNNCVCGLAKKRFRKTIIEKKELKAKRTVMN